METLDLRIGEATSIGELTYKLHSFGNRGLNSDPEDWKYNVAGYNSLVKFLENKHSSPIVITNGANQALLAAFSVLQQRGYKNMAIKLPYWNRIPDLLNQLKFKFSCYNGVLAVPEILQQFIDCCLLVMPNNPDGFVPSIDNLKLFRLTLQQKNIPLIHDAAYYTRTYLPSDYPIDEIGDMQIFSASKAYGLSGLRIGYIAVHNKDYYQDLIRFMEMNTVGVSLPSQKLFLSILEREEEVDAVKILFETQSKQEIKRVRKLFKEVDPSVIELPPSFDTACGMFAWVKVQNKEIFEISKIEVLDGAAFGDEEYVRINLGVGCKVIKEAVNRINNVAKEIRSNS